MHRVIEGTDALARVRADGTTTRYRRAGGGAPVLLLCDAADTRLETLLQVLAERHTVIAPEGAGGGDDVDWIPVERLAAFLDGLGVGPVPVVGVGRAAGPAAALARLHAGRVEKLVLLREPDGDPGAHARAALAALERESD